jgi:hypothetical protein
VYLIVWGVPSGVRPRRRARTRDGEGEARGRDSISSARHTARFLSRNLSAGKLGEASASSLRRTPLLWRLRPSHPLAVSGLVIGRSSIGCFRESGPLRGARAIPYLAVAQRRHRGSRSSRSSSRRARLIANAGAGMALSGALIVAHGPDPVGEFWVATEAQPRPRHQGSARA